MSRLKEYVKKGIVFSHSQLNIDTWNDYYESANEKKVILFGICDAVDFLFFYNPDIMVECIIDNDIRKTGVNVDLYLNKPYTNYINQTIYNDHILKEYNPNDVVILITNIAHTDDIADQLEQLGFTNFYSILGLEINRRNENELQWDETYRLYNKVMFPNEIFDEKKIVFYTMRGYSGHGKYIAKQLMQVRNDLDIVWIVEDMRIKVPDGIRLIYANNTDKYIHEMKTAKVWIDDDMLPEFITKKPEQIYIQVKHWASITLKAFGFDLANFRKDETQLKRCRHCSDNIDYLITGSRFDTETCRKGFDFNGIVKEFGSSRSDALFDPQNKSKVYEFFGIDPSKKILLYAPTFRSVNPDKYDPKAFETYIDYDMLVNSLSKYLSGEWVIMLRLHPVVARQTCTIQRPEHVIDASDYSDSQELVSACEIMIADYSSIMFEPAFVRKPVFLYAPDRKEYINGERPLLIDYDTLPFPIAETNEQLAENIMNFDNEKYIKDVDEFMDKYDVHEDGHASERAAKFISDLIDGKV